MSRDVSADGVDVEAVMAQIRERIAEKKRRGLLTDEEVREIAERPLHPVLDSHDFRSRLLAELLADRRARGPVTRKKAAPRKTAKKAPAKKATKKAAAKKTG